MEIQPGPTIDATAVVNRLLAEIEQLRTENESLRRADNPERAMSQSAHRALIGEKIATAGIAVISAGKLLDAGSSNSTSDLPRQRDLDRALFSACQSLLETCVALAQELDYVRLGENSAAEIKRRYVTMSETVAALAQACRGQFELEKVVK